MVSHPVVNKHKINDKINMYNLFGISDVMSVELSAIRNKKGGILSVSPLSWLLECIQSLINSEAIILIPAFHDNFGKMKTKDPSDRI